MDSFCKVLLNKATLKSTDLAVVDQGQNHGCKLLGHDRINLLHPECFGFFVLFEFGRPAGSGSFGKTSVARLVLLNHVRRPHVALALKPQQAKEIQFSAKISTDHGQQTL
eukprot:5959134-Amphidinium_carterae.1